MCKILAIWATLGLAAVLWAGNTGKIAGVVTDKQTGEPLVGVNVLVKGTNLGAATDEDGYFFILQVPPGTYELEFSYIGYHNLTVKNVTVRIDLTTHLEVQMESEAIEGPVVEVVAEQPLIQKDITATRRTTSREEIAQTPGFENTLDVFRLQAGATFSFQPQVIALGDGTTLQVRDQSLKDVHIRGGRGGEILYMVDGVPVTHPLYGGRDVLNLNVVDVEQMELLTGAFNAEYGQAQSGVVNIVTRSGGEQFSGGLEYKTDEVGPTGYQQDTQYMSFWLGGPEPFTNHLFPSIGLDLPGKMYFFLSGNGNMTNTAYNNHRTRSMFSVLGIRLREKQNNVGNLNAKLTWNLSNRVNFMFSYHGSWNRWSDFEWMWKNIPDHMPDYQRNTHNFILKLNHTLSRTTFYTVNLGFLKVNYNGSLRGQNPSQFWGFYKQGNLYDYESFIRLFPDQKPDSILQEVLPPQIDPLTRFFDQRSYDARWRDDDTRTYTFKGDLTSQIHPDHLVKTGLEVNYSDIHYIDIQDGAYKLSPYGEFRFRNGPSFPRPVGPYPEFGQLRWVFNAFPWQGGWYIQDKFEKETLILNAGVRVDWFMPGSTVFDEEWKRVWEAATGLKANWKRFRYKVSPRFGISFPISETMVAFFSYGHFNQLPELQFFYRDPYTGGLTGNPHLDFEQTILYEFGFTHQFARDWAIDIKSYAKDISNQVETTQLRAALGLPVQLYDNKGQGRARGLEFLVIKRHSHYFSGKLSYTVQWAKGFSSSAFEGYIRSLTDFPNPIRERRLAWDQRHQVLLQATIAAGPGQHPRLFGLKLPDNWAITILSSYATGVPYTPFTTDPAERQKIENTATGPPIANTDVKISKTFALRDLKLTLYVDIFNLFDNRNVNVDGRWFNTETGKPYRYGDRIEGTNKFYDWYTMLTKLDPRQFGPRRYAKLGLRFSF